MVNPLVTFKVHNVSGDPYEYEDCWWLDCLVEDPDLTGEDAMFGEEIPFNTREDAMKFRTHFLTSIQPVIIEFELGMEVKYDG
jgi:hypothetical protein|tara:strand:+ start:731 stop:979 length:249 start_codon:yes stop_codon:yes gene_type:complete